MLSIKVKDNESIDKALKRFKKKFERAGIMREYRGRTYFEKESVTRRNQVKRASYRQRKISKREQE
ncbi:MAG: 30S ribosomal protein S21 [Bacteroidota bacterium]